MVEMISSYQWKDTSQKTQRFPAVNTKIMIAEKCQRLLEPIVPVCPLIRDHSFSCEAKILSGT